MPKTSSPPKPTEKVADEHKVLSGWKDIANYLGKGVRTVQRYEQELNLPIHRPHGKSKALVMAVKGQLDGWMTADLQRTRSLQQSRIWEQSNRAGADFIRIDSEAALTFSGIALDARDEDKRRRTTRVARRAYEMITQLRENIKLSVIENAKLESNLNRLKSELQTLGENF